MSKDCCDKTGSIISAECIYDSGKFFLHLSEGCVPDLFTVRFIAPTDYTAGDVVVVKGKELPVRTPGMTSASSDIFKAGAVIHCDIDMVRDLAFFWQGGGNGNGAAVLPNLSYEEQFAGYYDENGDRVYVKVLDLGVFSDKSLKIPHGIDNLKNFQNMIIAYKIPASKSDAYRGFGNRYSPWTGTLYFHGSEDNTAIDIVIGSSDNIDLCGKATLYYTCTDR